MNRARGCFLAYVPPRNFASDTSLEKMRREPPVVLGVPVKGSAAAVAGNSQRNIRKCEQVQQGVSMLHKRFSFLNDPHDLAYRVSSAMLVASPSSKMEQGCYTGRLLWESYLFEIMNIPGEENCWGSTATVEDSGMDTDGGVLLPVVAEMSTFTRAPIMTTPCGRNAPSRAVELRALGAEGQLDEITTSCGMPRCSSIRESQGGRVGHHARATASRSVGDGVWQIRHNARISEQVHCIKGLGWGVDDGDTRYQAERAEAASEHVDAILVASTCTV